MSDEKVMRQMVQICNELPGNVKLQIVPEGQYMAFKVGAVRIMWTTRERFLAEKPKVLADEFVKRFNASQEGAP